MVASVAVGTHVAIVDDLSSFRVGLSAACFRAGLTLDEPTDLSSWARRRNAAAIITLSCARGWSALKTIRQSSTVTVLGLLPRCDVVHAGKRLRLGRPQWLHTTATLITLYRR